MNTQYARAFAQPDRASLDALIADLATKHPEDPSPATTARVVAYLRILQTCGPEEMMQAISTNIQASIGATKLLTRTFDEAAHIVLALTVRNAKSWGDTLQMKQAIVQSARGLLLLLRAYYQSYDHATNALIVALGDWIKVNEKELTK